MTRSATLLMTVALLVAAVGAVPLTGLAQPAADGASTGEVTDRSYAMADHENATDAADDDASDVPAGARLAGALGVQEAEFEGEVATRAFGIKVAAAASNDSKADVVSEEVRNVEARLEALRDRKAALREARDDGSIGNATFKAEMAELAARTETVKQLANRSEAEASGLPADLLASKGIDVGAIQELRRNASALAGPDVAAIARSIAGPNVGKSIARGAAPDHAGPPGEKGAGDRAPGNKGPSDRGPADGQSGDSDAETVQDDGEDAASAVDAAANEVAAARERVSAAGDQVGENASDEAVSALEDAKEQLAEAESALADARDALDAGNEDEAGDLADQAVDHAEQAVADAEAAIDAATADGSGDGDDGSDAGSTDDGSDAGGHRGG